MTGRRRWLADRGRLLTRAEIAKALNGHLCRCTGYVKIVDAVEMIFAAKRGVPLPELHTEGGVGQRMGRYQGVEMALGMRQPVSAVRQSEHAGRVRALSGQQCGARTRADGRGTERLTEQDPLVCEMLDVWCRNLVSVRLHVSPGVVGMQVQNVRRRHRHISLDCARVASIPDITGMEILQDTGEYGK